MQSEHGSLELAISRDCQSTFEPVLVPKHQRRLRGLDEKIVTLYARGLSTRDIALQLEELYGAQVTASLISEVTDTVNEDVKAWQKSSPRRALPDRLSRRPLCQHQGCRARQ